MWARAASPIRARRSGSSRSSPDPRGELRRIRGTRSDADHELSGMSRYVPVAETIVGTPATIAIESDPLTSPRCGKRRSTAMSAATSQARKSSSETS